VIYGPASPTSSPSKKDKELNETRAKLTPAFSLIPTQDEEGVRHCLGSNLIYLFFDPGLLFAD